MNFNSKKILIVLLSCILLLLGIVLAASLKEPATSAAPVQTLLKVAFFGNAQQQDSTNQLLHSYQESHPEVELEVKVYEPKSYDSYLAIAIASGTLPDVLMVGNTMIQELNYYNALADVSSYIGDDIPGTVLAKSLLPVQQGDKIYGFPVGVSTNAFVMNTDIFKRMRESAPNEINWENLIPISQEFKQILDNRGFTLSFPMNDFGIDLDTFIYFLKTIDRELIDSKGRLGFTRADIKNYLEINMQYRKESIIPPTASTADEFKKDPANSLMANRAMAVDYVCLYDIPYYRSLSKDTLVYFEDNERALNQIQGTYISVYANSQNLEAAKELAYYWYSDIEANKIWMAPYGMLPNEEVSSSISPFMDDERKQMDDTVLDYLSRGQFSQDFIGRLSMEIYFSKIYIDIAFDVITLQDGTDLIYDRFKFLTSNQ